MRRFRCSDQPCRQVYPRAMTPFANNDVDVEPERVAELREAGTIQLVDVREPYEWDAGRLEGSRHIELERLASQAEAIDRDRPVVFVCRLGARSAMAATAFRAAGYDAWSMRGGLTLWDHQGLPLIPDDGYVA